MGPEDVGHGNFVDWDGDLIPGLFELAMWFSDLQVSPPAEFCTFFPWICNLLLEPAWMRRRDFSTHYNLACWRNFAAISSRVRDEVVSFFNTTPWHHAFKIHTLARTKDARTVYSSFWIASLPSTGHFTWQNLRRTAETVRAEVTQAGSRDW